MTDTPNGSTPNTGVGVQTVTVAPNDKDMRLDKWFKDHYPALSFGKLQKKMRKGEVRLNGKRVKGKERLNTGDTIRIPPLDLADLQADYKPQKNNTPDLRDKDFVRDLVIYKTDDIIAINKPAGLAVQGGSHTKRHLDGMLPWLKLDGNDTPRLVHRLDKDTSGVMMLARNRQSAHDVTRAFRERTSRKIYWAIVVGELERDMGIIDEPLIKGGGKGAERVYVNHEDPNAKQAITWFSVLERFGSNIALVALWPRTGRTHQLRAHMAALDCPILGDGKYGGKSAHISDAKHAKMLTLHARELTDPLTGQVVTADLPLHILETFDMLGIAEKDIDTTIDPFAELLQD